MTSVRTRDDALSYMLMAAADTKVLRNADASWNMFSSDDYWRRNYRNLQAEDQEIIQRVSEFLVTAYASRQPAQRAIDVGAGTNLYPALLMLPWTEQIMLTDYSQSNVVWLKDHLKDDGSKWEWEPFWREIQLAKAYGDVDQPRKRLQEACVYEKGFAGVERRSVFDLPKARWDLGTMFFVAESITEDPLEFQAAVTAFVGALTPGAPFAAAFMAGSDGYPVKGKHYPALPINLHDVEEQLKDLGARKLKVNFLDTNGRVRDGYTGMIVATGYAGRK